MEEVDIEEDSCAAESSQLHVKKSPRTWRRPRGLSGQQRKRNYPLKRDCPLRVGQNRLSQEKARNKFTDILNDLTDVLNITEITRRLGDAYDDNKILVSKYDVLNLAGTYIQYLEDLLKDNGVANNFCRKTALENIQVLMKLSRVEEESSAVSLP